jgi:hypothetical protein
MLWTLPKRQQRVPLKSLLWSLWCRTIHAGLLHKGMPIALQWERRRVFDRDIAVALYTAVAEAAKATVTALVVREERKARPPGLNTVELLKVRCKLSCIRRDLVKQKALP